jgi:ubiquitin C-terminal hydrolase
MSKFPSYKDYNNNIYEPYGLRNTGSTCYLNSMMQGLFSCPLLNFYFEKLNNNESYEIIKEYLDLVQGRKLQISLILNDFMEKIPKNRGYSIAMGQEDAHESFICLIELINKLNPIISKNIYNMLFYRTVITNECDNCKYKTTNTETNNVLIIAQDQKSINNVLVNNEKISEFGCEKCKKNTTSSYSTNILRIGPILIICLKQFNDKFLFETTDTLYFPDNNNSKMEYILVAQLDQLGTKDSGHYYGIYRRKNGIFIINDSIVTPSSGFNITKNTYMLIYNYNRTIDKSI